MGRKYYRNSALYQIITQAFSKAILVNMLVKYTHLIGLRVCITNILVVFQQMLRNT